MQNLQSLGEIQHIGWLSIGLRPILSHRIHKNKIKDKDFKEFEK